MAQIAVLSPMSLSSLRSQNLTYATMLCSLQNSPLPYSPILKVESLFFLPLCGKCPSAQQSLSYGYTGS